MSNLTTLPKGDSAWLLRKSIQRIMQQVSVLETNIGSSTTGNSSNTQVIFNDNGTLRGDAGLTYNAATDTLTAGSATITGDLTLTGGTANGVPYLNASKVVTTSDKLSFANTPGFFDTTLNINSLLGSALYRGGITVSEDDIAFTLFGGSGYKLIQTSGFSVPNQLRFYASNAEQYRIGASGVFTWYDGAGGTRMTLNSTGLGVGVTPSAGKGALQLSSGINFPATQVASSDVNTLDDYEEGTWTGTLKGSVSDPTTPVTATGRYTKIGRQVFVQIEFLNFSNVGASGHITVTGLPFNAVGGACVGIPFMNKVGTYTGNPIAYLTGTIIELYAMTSNSQETTITHNAGTGRYMTLSITFTV